MNSIHLILTVYDFQRLKHVILQCHRQNPLLLGHFCLHCLLHQVTLGRSSLRHMQPHYYLQKSQTLNLAIGPTPSFCIDRSFGSGFITVSLSVPSPSRPKSFLPHAPTEPSLNKTKENIFIVSKVEIILVSISMLLLGAILLAPTVVLIQRAGHEQYFQ